MSSSTAARALSIKTAVAPEPLPEIGPWDGEAPLGRLGA